MTTDDLLHIVDAAALERVRRLEVALQLIRAGYPRREVSGTLQRRFSIAQPTAWRIVEMAWDLAGGVNDDP